MWFLGEWQVGAGENSLGEVVSGAGTSSVG